MVHMQTGIWISKLSNGASSEPGDNPTPTNYKAWVKRFTDSTAIPITVYILCVKGHLHKWDSIFPNESNTPNRLFCGHEGCKLALFENLLANDTDRQPQDFDKQRNYKPILLYPVFDLFSQLRAILKRKNAYKDLTAYKRLLKPKEVGVWSEIYHEFAFQAIHDAGLNNEDEMILDLFLQGSLDWASMTTYSVNTIGPMIVRVLNFLLPDRIKEHTM